MRSKKTLVRMDQRRPAHVENDGQRKARRCKDRQGFEAKRRCNTCDGRKAPRVVEYARVKTFAEATLPLRSTIGNPGEIEQLNEL